MEELQAPSHWRCIDFISDLHLQASEPATFSAWRDYLQHSTADAVFILGDLFEVWVGDDVLTDAHGFEHKCAQVLREAAQRLDVFIMHGNRDFLMGQRLMQTCGSRLVQDPTVLSFATQRWLLSHGDALCLGDTAYLQFRQSVRSASWQNDFLSKPLEERKTFARQLRSKSESIKNTKMSYADVDTTAAIACLQSGQATTMIHGHTHRPARHDLAQGLERIVLSDWDLSAIPPRADVLRLRQCAALTASGAVVERISPAQACATGAKPRG